MHFLNYSDARTLTDGGGHLLFVDFVSLLDRLQSSDEGDYVTVILTRSP